jgi:hypothetical protein
MADAKQGVLALIMYASDNQGQIPPTLAQSARYLKNGAADGIAADYDLVYSGPISGIAKPAETILLKQKTGGRYGRQMDENLRLRRWSRRN